MEQTLVILKPDAVNRGLVGEILHRFERKGLKIAALKMEHLKEDKLNEHYAHHKDKPFFKGLVKFMSSIPSVLIVLEGKDCVSVVRNMVGETSGRKALPGTVRGDFSMSVQTNVIHVSDSVENARIEVKRFFTPKEVYSYNRIDADCIYSADEKE